MLHCYPQPQGLLHCATAPPTSALGSAVLHSTFTQKPPAPLFQSHHTDLGGWGGSKVGKVLASEAWQPEFDALKPHLKKKTQDEAVGICNPNTQVGTGETPATQEHTDPASGTR